MHNQHLSKPGCHKPWRSQLQHPRIRYPWVCVPTLLAGFSRTTAASVLQRSHLRHSGNAVFEPAAAVTGWHLTCASNTLPVLLLTYRLYSNTQHILAEGTFTSVLADTPVHVYHVMTKLYLLSSQSYVSGGLCVYS